MARDARRGTFPFYIAHQTLIVVVGGWLLPYRPGPVAEFAILVISTVAGCAAFYLIGRRIAWLRLLIGLGARRPAAAMNRAAA